jgi:hypothetical protein
MTNGAVVVVDFLFISGLYERDRQQSRAQPQRTQTRNHVLMLIVGKLDRELALDFWFRRLIRIVWRAEIETCCFAGSGANVANCTDCRTGSAHCLARKKLRPMTTHAGLVIRKIRHVRKIALGIPGGWDLMTGVAGQAFVFVR